MSRVLDFWFEPIAEARLRLFGRVFALTFLIYMVAWLIGGGDHWFTDAGFHLSPEAEYRNRAPSLPPLPAWAFIPFTVWLLGLSFVATLGLGGRWVFALLVPTAIYIQLVERMASFTLNKLFVVTFLLLALQSGAVLIRGRNRDERRQSAWPLRVLQSMLLIQYATAGLCKVLHGDWLEVHDILFGHSVGIYRTAVAAWVVHHLPHSAWTGLSSLALGFELAAPLLFCVQKLRPIAFILGIGMHISIAVLMDDLVYFSLQMMSFYILFLPERWVVRADDWMRHSATAGSTPALSPLRR